MPLARNSRRESSAPRRHFSSSGFVRARLLGVVRSARPERKMAELSPRHSHAAKPEIDYGVTFTGTGAFALSVSPVLTFTQLTAIVVLLLAVSPFTEVVSAELVGFT